MNETKRREILRPADHGGLSHIRALIFNFCRDCSRQKKGETMFITSTVLTALISGMFVASVASTISALRRESEDFKSPTASQNAL